jgi:DNA-binding NtrC family response regulator
MVADDDGDLREALRYALEIAGYRVLSAADGQEAVALFREHQALVDTVILDLIMPRMSGAQALAELRSMRSDVPVIVLSGYITPDMIEHLRSRGVLSLLQKPCSLERLLEEVNHAMAH